MERTFGAVLTTGYFTFNLDTGRDSEVEATHTAYHRVISNEALHGSFNMPGCPSHAYAPMRINPDHVVGVILIPEREL